MLDAIAGSPAAVFPFRSGDGHGTGVGVGMSLVGQDTGRGGATAFGLSQPLTEYQWFRRKAIAPGGGIEGRS